MNFNQPALINEPAKQAGSFVDTLGVNVHLNYLDTSYGQYQDVIKPKLLELEVHHIRDGIPAKAEQARAKIQDLSESGIKTLLIVDPKHFKHIPDAIPMIKALRDSLDAVEGPNEWDWRPGLTYQGQAFPAGLQNFQSEFYAAVKQDPETARLSVIAPSIVKTENAAQLGAVACDIGNMHTYLGSYPSEPRFFQKVAAAQMVCPEKSVMATEAGWYGKVTDPQSKGVSERVAGKLIPRLWLEFFNRGVQRTYIYELIDLFPEDGDKEYRFGLLRSDGSAKPAFIALKNMVHLLSEDSSSFIPESLSYRLEGDISSIHHTLLQKQNRTFFLILWQEVPAFNRHKQDLVVSDRNVTLKLQTPIHQARMYRPLESDQPLAVWQEPSSIRLQIPDHPLILELSPT